MIEIYKTELIPENCSTCLYGKAWGCLWPERREDWKQYRGVDAMCPSYLLDHTRFKPVWWEPLKGEREVVT